MTPEQFVYWISGLLEGLEGSSGLSCSKTDLIKRHLALVIECVTQEEEPKSPDVYPHLPDPPTPEETEEFIKRHKAAQLAAKEEKKQAESTKDPVINFKPIDKETVDKAVKESRLERKRRDSEFICKEGAEDAARGHRNCGYGSPRRYC